MKKKSLKTARHPRQQESKAAPHDKPEARILLDLILQSRASNAHTWNERHPYLLASLNPDIWHDYRGTRIRPLPLLMKAENRHRELIDRMDYLLTRGDAGVSFRDIAVQLFFLAHSDSLMAMVSERLAASGQPATEESIRAIVGEMLKENRRDHSTLIKMVGPDYRLGKKHNATLRIAREASACKRNASVAERNREIRRLVRGYKKHHPPLSWKAISRSVNREMTKSDPAYTSLSAKQIARITRR